MHKLENKILNYFIKDVEENFHKFTLSFITSSLR